jgi:hypothetical protein
VTVPRTGVEPLHPGAGLCRTRREVPTAQLTARTSRSYRQPVARRIDPGTNGCRTTDHSQEVAWLRAMSGEGPRVRTLTYLVAADLLEAHDDTGLSLDEWRPARALIEALLDCEILPNGA